MMNELFFIGFFITIVLLIIIGVIKTKVKKKYESETKVSIILTCEDVSYLEIILPLLLKFDNVDDIHILYRSKDNFIEHKEDCIHDTLADKDYKTYSEMFQFKQFSNVNNECILFLTGNVILSERFFLKLLSNYDMDIENLYGPYSKQCDEKGYSKNRMMTNTINLPIIMTSKKVVQHCWNTLMENNVIRKQMHDSSTESADVFFSYAFRKHFKKYPITVNGRVYNLLQKNGKEDTKTQTEQCKSLSQKSFI